MQKEYGIHWFRRDLRIVGNPALLHNVKLNNGNVLGIFFFDSSFLSRKDFSHNRFGLFLNTLKSLKSDLKKMGGDLLILDTLPEKGFLDLLNELGKGKYGMPKTISYNRDYEPFALKRDKTILEVLSAYEDIEVISARDHLILEPREIQKIDGGYYQIYSPFCRTWLSAFAKETVQQRIQFSTTLLKSLDKKIFSLKWKDFLQTSKKFEDQLDSFIAKNEPHITVPLPEVGFEHAYKQILAFKMKLKNYDNNRNYPELEGTSKLSIYLKNGTISTALIFELLKPDLNSQFTKELIWREFYYHILAHDPRVETESFHKKYDKIKWDNNKTYFKAWKEGKTGFPIVDAGMRELLKTGLMHNRVRMIVASFLTKDLLIDWRWGEKWFMQNLLDGDIAANNGGWQWAASTGCDPQPYFRIFNPTLQSKKFDPTGEYIRKYVPELKGLANKEIHEPSDAVRPKNYPAPIVHHSEQRKIALAVYARV